MNQIFCKIVGIISSIMGTRFIDFLGIAQKHNREKHIANRFKPSREKDHKLKKGGGGGGC